MTDAGKRLDLEFAERTMRDTTVELEDMLMRVRKLDFAKLAQSDPDVVLALWQSLGEAQSAILNMFYADRYHDLHTKPAQVAA